MPPTQAQSRRAATACMAAAESIVGPSGAEDSLRPAITCSRDARLLRPQNVVGERAAAPSGAPALRSPRAKPWPGRHPAVSPPIGGGADVSLCEVRAASTVNNNNQLLTTVINCHTDSRSYLEVCLYQKSRGQLARTERREVGPRAPLQTNRRLGQLPLSGGFWRVGQWLAGGAGQSAQSSKRVGTAVTVPSHTPKHPLGGEPEAQVGQ